MKGFTSPAESQALAGKVITLISHFNGTRDETERLKRYLRQTHSYTIAQEQDIDAMWSLYRSRKIARALRKKGF